MLAMIIVKLLIWQPQLAFGQRDVPVFDRHLEERMNPKVDLNDRQILQQRPLMIRT